MGYRASGGSLLNVLNELADSLDRAFDFNDKCTDSASADLLPIVFDSRNIS